MTDPHRPEQAARIAVAVSLTALGIGTAAGLAYVPALLWLPVGFGAFWLFYGALMSVRQAIEPPPKPRRERPRAERDDAHVPDPNDGDQ